MRAATAPRPRTTAGGTRARGAIADYAAAIDDPRIDAVVVAVPPTFHLDLTLRALRAGKHVLVEKPAFLRIDEYRAAIDARNQAKRVVLVGENDHYKPLAVVLRTAACRRRDRRDGVRALHDDREAAENRRRLAQRRAHGRRRRVLRGRHSLAAHGRKPRSANRVDRRIPPFGIARRPGHAREKHDGRVPVRQRCGGHALLLARNTIALQGTAIVEAVWPQRHHHVRVERRCSCLREAAAFRGSSFPGFRDIRGYQAMYRDFHGAITEGRAPEMSLERAIDDQRLMDDVYSSLRPTA